MRWLRGPWMAFEWMANCSMASRKPCWTSVVEELPEVVEHLNAARADAFLKQGPGAEQTRLSDSQHGRSSGNTNGPVAVNEQRP
jgi:hypothetical protein